MSVAVLRKPKDARSAIAAARLLRQGIAGPAAPTPELAVSRLLAMQAQDYYGALWAVGLRTQGANEADVARAIDQGRLVRTWPMRGTLHLLAAEDVRWMMALTGARASALNAGRLQRQYGLDAATMKRCRRIAEKTLRDGPVTRAVLYAALQKAGIDSVDSHGINIPYQILGQLSQQALLCGGPRAGKQPTFVWLDAWLPPAEPLPREEALAALAARYFASRGPATAQDLAWWSGLTLKDVQAAIAAAGARIASQTIDGIAYWSANDAPAPDVDGRQVHLLPSFDEYLVAYKDRSLALDPAFGRQVIGANGLFNPSLVSDGRVVAT